MILFILLCALPQGYGQNAADTPPPVSEDKNTVKNTPKNTGKKKEVPNEDATVLLNLNNVDLKSFIDTVSRSIGRTFLVDDRLVQGKKVNFSSDKRYTIEEVYSIFEAILDAEGLATVKEDKFIRIVAKADATKLLTKVDVKRSEQGEDFTVTQVIRIRNSDVNLIRNTIQPFISPVTNITQYPPENLIIIRDSLKNINRIRQLIELIEGGGGRVRVKRIALKSQVNQAINILNKAFQSDIQRSNAGARVGLFPEPESNSVIVVGDSGFIRRVSDFINDMDFNDENVQNESRILTIKYADIATIITAVDSVFKSGSGSQNYKIVNLPDSKQLMVFSSKAVFTDIKAFVEQLDVESASMNLEIINVVNASAEDMVKLINSIFDGSASKTQNSTGQVNFRVLSDTRTNKLIILAREPVIKKIKVLLKEFDRKIGNLGGNYRVYRLNYTSAEEIAKVLQGVTQGIIAQTGGKAATAPVSGGGNNDITIIPDKSTNSLVIYAKPEQFNIIEKVISELDVVRPQVYVEAMIMEVTLDKTLNLGADWKAVSLTRKNGEVEYVTTVSGGEQTAGISSFPPSSPNGSIIGVVGKPFTFGGQQFSTFSAFIRAQERNSEVNILSSPQIMTLNNVKAKVKAGEVRAFLKEIVTDSNGRDKQSYDYKDIGVEMELTPQINPDKTIRMEIVSKFTDVKQNSQSSNVYTPETLNREITTTVSVKDDDIIVLGGLISDKIQLSERKVPCLGDIPLVGWLFKSETRTNNKTNLLVFISPRIISNEADLKERIESIKQNFNEASDERFRLNVSDEFGMPGIKQLNLKRDIEKERKEERNKNDKIREQELIQKAEEEKLRRVEAKNRKTREEEIAAAKAEAERTAAEEAAAKADEATPPVIIDPETGLPAEPPAEETEETPVLPEDGTPADDEQTAEPETLNEDGTVRLDNFDPETSPVFPSAGGGTPAPAPAPAPPPAAPAPAPKTN
ncbi:hypothetical protein CHS0354_018497 [Potamilus streckersoni]|uniref:Type II secretion system protein GspD n=1 Tax=Potamilus streckersoni TaxID=2493646 RepID=A0AAE0WAY4_9BIVA|nr:hypothetical protein CHS0354_018497 [Potamilus streckersoni]